MTKLDKDELKEKVSDIVWKACGWEAGEIGPDDAVDKIIKIVINELASAKEEGEEEKLIHGFVAGVLVKEFVDQLLAQAISSERQRVIDEVKKAIIKAINYGTLPDPNPYGNMVRLQHYNHVIKEIENILLSVLTKLEKGNK